LLVVEGMAKRDPATFINCVVGEIIKCKTIEGSSKLYSLEVDVGNDQVRHVVTAARKFYTIEDLKNKKVCVFANSEHTQMFGEISEGILLGCGTDENHVELLEPPLESSPGDRVSFGSYTDEEPEEIDHSNQHWKGMQKHLRVNANGEATYRDEEIMTDYGTVTAATLRNCGFH
jgi:methionine--tRNA ligase beta chain